MMSPMIPSKLSAFLSSILLKIVDQVLDRDSTTNINTGEHVEKM